MANNYFGMLGQQTLFPTPNGSVYSINNSLEVANIPTGAGITIALCPSESLMYIKSMQNGQPVFSAYKISPYVEPQRQAAKDELAERVANLEKIILALQPKNGGKQDEKPATKPDGNDWQS